MMISSLLSLLFLVLLSVLIFFSFVGEDEEVVASDIDDGSNEESLHDMLLPPLIVWLQSASSPTGVSSSPSVLSSSSLPLPN